MKWEIYLLLIPFTYNKIHHFKAYSSVFFRIFTKLCNHHHCLVSEILITQKKKTTPYLLAFTPYFPSSSYNCVFHLLGTDILFPQWPLHFIFPLVTYEGTNTSTSLQTLIIVCFFCFYVLVILEGVKWYITIVLIWFSLMTTGVEHLLIYLLAIYISNLEKCLFKFFTHFKIGLFVFFVVV